MPTLEDTITIATEAHRGKKDKNGAPYILHPLRVMVRMSSETDKMVAVLHDVIEDSPVTMEQLKKIGYPLEVLEAIDCLTHRKDQESYEQYIDRSRTNPIALRVKIADLEDNMDIRRFDELTERDLDRLNKYLKAWRDLTKE